jgi:nucleobase:cation symporter-1, NCS1 family
LPQVETYGVEPIPEEQRTVRWLDLFAINFGFYLNPLMYLFGALAVTSGGLPFPYAVLALFTGQVIAFAALVVIAQVGVDYGLPGQVALRATLGYWGARLLSSPYRVVAATYWFAAQALAAAYAAQALLGGLAGWHPRLVPTALVIALIEAVLAVVGFDVMRLFVKVVLPLGLVFTCTLVALYLTSDNPHYAVSHVWRSPGLHWTWVGFATWVTVITGSTLSYVTNIADFCRYTPTRRDMRIGLWASALAGVLIPASVGAYAAVATGSRNPFVAAVDLTHSKALLVILLLSLASQSTAVNVTNVYTAGLSLVNSLPRLGRTLSTVAVAAVAVGLSAFPDLVNHAQKWIGHVGNVAAALTGVILVDYVVLKHSRIEVDELFDPNGRYRYLNGVNVAAVLGVAAGVAVYYTLPQTWLRALWSLGVAGAAYLVLTGLQSLSYTGTGAVSQRSSSPS